MNAAAVQRSTVPVAASPTGITPAAGQGFVPASAASGNESAPSADQVLQSIVQVLGDEYLEPIIAPDGTIYMERRKPKVVNGALSLSFLVVGKLDRASGKLTPSPDVVELVQSKAQQAGGAQRVLVQIGDQMVWQTLAKDKDGKPVVTDMAVASEQEVAAWRQQQAAKAAAQSAQERQQDLGQWQQKIGVVSQGLGIFGSTGQLLSGLAGGPNPYTGRPGAGWLSGWILAQRLNGAAEGKLLPEFMQSGPLASVIEWGVQAYGMLDMGSDVRTIRDFITKAPAAASVNPAAAQQLAASGMHPTVAQAVAGLGSELRSGSLQLVDGTANAAVINTKLGAVQLVPRADLQAAFNATDPLQDGGLRLRSDIDAGVVKGMGLLRGLVQPAMMGATVLGLASSLINVNNIVSARGAEALIDTQQGRGALLGAVSSAAFLGMYLVPMVLPQLGVASAAVTAVSSAVNLASNVLGGVQLLNSYGLFGDNGFLNNDAFRAAFLVPPLTPIGAFAFWMQRRRAQAEEEAAKLQAAQKVAVERVTQQREMAKLQLQSTGQISGAVPGEDGTLLVSTNVPEDLSKLANST